MLENDTFITRRNRSRHSRVLTILTLKSGQGITKGESLEYGARFTENDVTSDKSQFPNISN